MIWWGSAGGVAVGGGAPFVKLVRGSRGNMDLNHGPYVVGIMIVGRHSHVP